MAPSANNQLVEMFGQLLSKLDAVSDLKKDIGILVTQMGLLTDSHNKLTNTVMGNGKPGHADRIRDLEENCENLEQWRLDLEKKDKERAEEKKEHDKEMRGMRNSIVVAVIIFILTTLLNIGMTYWITAHEAAEKVISGLAH